MADQLSLVTEPISCLSEAVRIVKQAGYKVGRRLDKDLDPNFDWADDVDDEDEPVRIKLTGSIQDAELSEAITDAYAKHGHRLAELIRNL